MKKKPAFYGKRDPRTDVEWEELATYKGVESGPVLKEQTRKADEVIYQIFFGET